MKKKQKTKTKRKQKKKKVWTAASMSALQRKLEKKKRESGHKDPWYVPDLI